MTRSGAGADPPLSRAGLQDGSAISQSARTLSAGEGEAAIGTAGRQASVRRPIVVVLGMHRSGTSLCSRILSALGVDMADDVGRGAGNESGHWERWELVSLHDRLLDALGRPYGSPGEYNPAHDLPLPRGWLADPAAHAVQREIETFLKNRMYPGRLFGFKDPRTSRFLPLWMDVFDRLALEPRFVVCVRNPADVAQSLRRRDNIPTQAGEYRWFIYNSDCLRHVGTEALLVSYENWFSKPDHTIERLRQFVLPDARRPIPKDVLSVVEAELDHGTSQKAGDTSHPIVADFVEKLRRFEVDPLCRPEVDAAIDAFDRCQAMNPFGAALLSSLVKEEEYRERAEGAVITGRQAEAAARAEIERLMSELQDARDQILASEVVLASSKAALAQAESSAAAAQFVAAKADEDLAARSSELDTVSEAQQGLCLVLEEARQARDDLERELERASSRLSTARATLAVALGDDGAADPGQPLGRLCEDIAVQSSDVATALHSAQTRIRSLEQALATPAGATPEEAGRIAALTRKLAALEASLRARPERG